MKRSTTGSPRATEAMNRKLAKTPSLRQQCQLSVLIGNELAGCRCGGLMNLTCVSPLFDEGQIGSSRTLGGMPREPWLSTAPRFLMMLREETDKVQLPLNGMLDSVLRTNQMPWRMGKELNDLCLRFALPSPCLAQSEEERGQQSKMKPAEAFGNLR